jgi:hypothetical protein
MIRLLPHYLRPPSVRKLDRRHTGRLKRRDNLFSGEAGKEPNYTELYDGEKA